MKSRRSNVDVTTKKTADAAHVFYDDVINPFLAALAGVKPARAEALAMLLYSAYANAYYDHRPFEDRHDPLTPHEADICKAIADGLLVGALLKPMKTETIETIFASDKL